MNSESNNEDELYSKMLLTSVVKGYETNFNKINDKNEIKYLLTLTHHKVPTKDGNKDVAYLRLDKSVKSKLVIIEDPNLPEEMKVPEWKSSLVHQEAYPFRDLKERLNPDKPWEDYLYQAMIARLVGAGLEYAELLQRLKKTSMEELVDNKLDLEITDKLPTPLSPAEEEYKEWVKKQKEQLTN
jgi:hypothetical protein